MNYVLLMMGGVGSRFGADIPKQFTEVEGIPLFVYIAKKIAKQSCVNGIVIVVNSAWKEFTTDCSKKYKLGKIISIVEGGTTRSESVFNGLKALLNIAAADDVVLIHDTTHPYVDEKGTRMVAEMTAQYGSATLASLNYDTTYLMDDDNNVVRVIPRQHVIAGASPEGFKYKQIFDIYKETPTDIMETMTSVGAIALANNIPLKVVPTTTLNLKITYPNDMNLFLLLFKKYYFND